MSPAFSCFYNLKFLALILRLMLQLSTHFNSLFDIKILHFLFLCRFRLFNPFYFIVKKKYRQETKLSRTLKTLVIEFIYIRFLLFDITVFHSFTFFDRSCGVSLCPHRILWLCQLSYCVFLVDSFFSFSISLFNQKKKHVPFGYDIKPDQSNKFRLKFSVWFNARVLYTFACVCIYIFLCGNEIFFLF